LRVFTLVFAEETVMDQFLERLFDGGVTRLVWQFREPPLKNPGLCVLSVWILAQLFPDRSHSLSYARFVHHIFCRLGRTRSNTWTTWKGLGFITRA